MNNAPSLPTIRDRDQYKSIYRNDDLWNPVADFISCRHDLSGERRRAQFGSHIVYRVGDFWIKLMAPLFAKDMPLEVSGLNCVGGKLSVPTPMVVAKGRIEDWHYVILSHIEGTSLREFWPGLSPDEKRELAQQIGRVVREIRTCEPDEIIRGRFNWNDFICGQIENIDAHQTRKNLPIDWRKALPIFLESFGRDDFRNQNPVFLHADLTHDHFLATRNGSVKLSGIIDMADCQIGHPEYELVAPCTFIFKGQREPLREFLINCGFKEEELNQRFSEKLLAWSFLHRYFSLANNFSAELSRTSVGDFRTLAKFVFPMGKINEA